MVTELKKGVYWVGVIDWAIRKFHGHELSTHRGTTYNSYLIVDEKVVLVDTVWGPFQDQLIENIRQIIDPAKIDIVVANHAETDHSGSLTAVMRVTPQADLIVSNRGLDSVEGHYHQPWKFKAVQTGDKISLGKNELIFVEAPMLHWPDSMFCYLTGDNILFSNDAFGQHYATELLFNDLVDQAELFQECIKYYANILTPFSALVDKKIKEFVGLNLPLAMICTSHGVVWRDNPLQIVTKYAEWAANYQENQVTIIYDTMWNGTRRMAEAIAAGITEADSSVAVKVFNVARSDKNDIITEVFKSKAILVGSPTVNKVIPSAVAGMLEEMRGLGFKNKKAAAFGAYGWSGESVKMITERLKEGGFTVIHDGLKELWNPNEQGIANCVAFGKEFALQLK